MCGCAHRVPCVRARPSAATPNPRQWDAATPATRAAIIEAYRPRCCTLGRTITLETASGEVTGEAVDIDPSGALVIEVDGARQTVFAGDAHHRS